MSETSSLHIRLQPYGPVVGVISTESTLENKQEGRATYTIEKMVADNDATPATKMVA